MGTTAKGRCYGFGYLNTAADGHKVHVVAGAVQEDVTDVAADDVALAVQFIGYPSNQFHDRQIDVIGYFLTVNIHFLFFRLQN
jgi:hypothetical protein